MSSLLDRAIRHRACALKDTAYALISTELDPEFEKLCEDITKARERRGKWTKICALQSSLAAFWIIFYIYSLVCVISFTRYCMGQCK